MPIGRYHTRESRSDKGLVLLGRLRKGAPKVDPKRPGNDLEYFRFEAEDSLNTTHQPGKRDEVQAAFARLYGDKPARIPNVMFASDNLLTVFDEWMEQWGMSQKGAPLLNRRCTGDLCTFSRMGETVSRDPQPCLCRASGRPLCQPSGRLFVFLPELCREIGMIGQVMVITHGTTDLDNIRSTLLLAQEKIGGLRNIAFILSRQQEIITTPDGAPVRKYIVHLDFADRAAQQLALSAGDGLDALPAPPSYALPAASAPRRDEAPPEVFIEGASPVPPVGTMKPRGVVVEVVINHAGKHTYHLKLDSGAKIPLNGFDALRSLGGTWPERVEGWKTMAAGTYPVPHLNAYNDGTGWLFETLTDDDIPF